MSNKQQTRKDFDKPKEVPAVQRAFPANVVGSWLPPRAWFAEDNVPQQWESFANSIFFGKGLTGIALIPKDGIDAKMAWEHATMILGSYEPKHEHKTEGVAWLLWHWFEEGEYQLPHGKDGALRTYELSQT